MTRALIAAFAIAATAAVAAQQRPPADPRNAGGGNCSANPYNCVDTANPLTPPDTVWMEEMTWMDVRDAVKAGKTTVIIATGGVEPNGPWLALGKHNYVLRTNCDAIARRLGNALCAPIVPFVPEGSIEPKSSHMLTVGTISLEEATFEGLLTDIARSYKAHGFENVIFIGDSGGNQDGQKAVAEKLNAEWAGKTVVAHIPQYYDYPGTAKYFADQGLIRDGKSDEMHDDPIIALNMFNTNPNTIRYEQRVKAGKASINGVDLSNKAKSTELAKKIVDYRATVAVDAIKKAIANKGKSAATAQ